MYEENNEKKKKEKKSQKIEKEVVEEKIDLENEEPQEKKRISFHADWVSIAVKLCILLVVAFVFIFVITRFKSKGEKEVFSENIEKMRTAAYNYFKDEDHRYLEEDKEISLSLKEMEKTGIINDVKDSKEQSCDDESSYVELSKINDSKYNLDVHLKCNHEEKTSNYTLVYNSSKEEKKDDDSNKEEEKKEITTLYEQKRTTKTLAQYTCPDGYVLDGGSCYSKVETISTKAIPRYKTIPSKSVKATKVPGEEQIAMIDAIATEGKTTLQCPSQFTLVNGVCEYTVKASKKTTYDYICPSGTTLEGNKCVKTINGTSSKTTYSCPKGTLTKNNQCYITANVSTKCKYGTYDSKTKQCYTLVDAQKNWGEWEYKGLYSSSKQVSSKKENVKYVFYRYSNKKYIYKKYTRKVKSYSCLLGKYYKNGKCKDYDDAYEQTYCKSGYTLDKKSNKCYKLTNAVAKLETSISCPSGYTRDKNECKKYTNATRKENVVYSCQEGFNLTSDNKCVLKREPTKKVSPTTYTCKDGYELDGKTCFKKIIGEDTYTCEEGATLKNDECIIPQEEVFIGYKCPTNYELSGDTCYYFTKQEKIKATLVSPSKTNTEIIWSEEKYLDGYTWTGSVKKS